MKRLPSWISVLPSLVVPVSIGLSLYLGLQYLIDTQVIVDETVLRYLTGHPVSKITVAMFLVGIASLFVLGWNLIGQFSAENNISLGEATDTTPNQDVRELAVDHGQFLLELPNRYHNHYLWDRLVAAVHSIYRTGSTASVEDELKYLSDMEQERQQQRYSLVRILIWATPMLGFLGTVLGISQALGGIAIGPENDFQEMMNGLRGSLYIAFDTTALALTLSMLMMFGLFLIERFDSQLLRLVDQRAHSEIAKHYEIMSGGSFDSAQIVAAIKEVVVSQTEIWRESIRKAEQAWTSTLTQTSDIVRGQLSQSLDENIAALAHYLGESIDKADMSISHRWSQWQVSLSENARLMEQHLLTLGVQTKSVERIVNSLDESTHFEQAMKHQQNAVMATTRTHRVLNELLDKVQEAKLTDRILEPAMLQSVQSSVGLAAENAMNTNTLPVAKQTAEESDTSVNVEETIVESPVIHEPVVESPAIHEPVVESPAIHDPVVEKQVTAPVAVTETAELSEPSISEADDERTLVLIFSEDEEEAEQQQPVAESPQMKIFEAEAEAEESESEQQQDFSSLLVDADNTPAPVPSEIAEVAEPPAEEVQPVQETSTQPADVSEPPANANQSRSAKIARALTEDGETEKPSVTFGAKINKSDSDDDKRAA